MITLETIEGRPQLHFYFNNRIDSEPVFCHQVRGVLTHTQGGIIHLTVKSIENGEERKETLLSGVQKLEFSFLFQDSSGTFIESKDLKNSDQSNLRGVKLSAWKNSNKPLTFIFWFPYEMNSIQYDPII